MDEAIFRECVFVGALDMARGDLVRLQDWLRVTRNCVGDVRVVDRNEPIKVSEYAATDRSCQWSVEEGSREDRRSAHSEGMTVV